MAQTVYVSKVAVSLATRTAAYNALRTLIHHLDAFDLNLISIVRRADNFIEITINNPLPVGQADHLGLQGA